MMKTKHEWAEGEGQSQGAWSAGLEKAKQKWVGREEAGTGLSWQPTSPSGRSVGFPL